MKVIVQGAGVVGALTGALLSDLGHEVAYYDPPREMYAVGPADVTVICTLCPDGTLPKVVPEAARYVVRSTVTPEALKVLPKPRYHWPEFLTERTAERDVRHPDKLIWGVDDPVEGLGFVEAFLGEHWRSIDNRLVTSIRSSCLIKLGINTIYTIKVLMANALHDAVEGDAADYASICQGLALDHRLTVTHTNIWQDGSRGAGGKCLPKDSEIFAGLMDGSSVGPFLREVVNTNDRLRFT